MSHNEMLIEAPATTVWEILSDPPRYGDFVVGNRRVRAYDDSWPVPGSTLHHAVGVGPLELHDSSTVVEVDAPTTLRIHAGIRPAGVGEVRFHIIPAGSGASRLVVEEFPIRGPITWLPTWLSDLLLNLRNRELLRRVRRLAEERAREVTGSGGGKRASGDPDHDRGAEG